MCVALSNFILQHQTFIMVIIIMMIIAMKKGLSLHFQSKQRPLEMFDISINGSWLKRKINDFCFWCLHCIWKWSWNSPHGYKRSREYRVSVATSFVFCSHFRIHWTENPHIAPRVLIFCRLVIIDHLLNWCLILKKVEINVFFVLLLLSSLLYVS